MTTWFISGASSGIGAELARQVARRGDDVAVAARRVDRLTQLAQELASAPGRVTVHELDVTDHAAVEQVLHAVDDACGGLDVVVANAGIGGGSRIGSGDQDANVAVVATNLVGVVSQAEVALSMMQPRDRGQVVLVGSVAARRGFAGGAAIYSATKAAVARLGEGLAMQVRGTGVAVTTIHPGYVDSEMTERIPQAVKASTSSAVATMLAAIDRRAVTAYVPRWWRPAASLLPVLPDALLRRFM